MNDASEPEFDSDALDLLDAFRQEEQIPGPLQQRVWDRVAADIGTAAPVTTSTRTYWARSAAVAGLLAAAALAVLWMGGRVLDADGERATPNQAMHERAGSSAGGVARSRAEEPTTEPQKHRAPEVEAAPEPAPAPEPEPASAVEPEPAADASTAETPRRSTSRRSVTPPATPSPSAPVDTLAEENRLLAKARAALLRDRPEQALGLLADHARRFRDGVLAEERKALHAVALCEAGRDDEGAAAARSFLRAHPQATLAQRVRSACLE